MFFNGGLFHSKPEPTFMVKGITFFLKRIYGQSFVQKLAD